METQDDNLLSNVFDTITTEAKRNENRDSFYDKAEKYAQEYVKKVRQELDDHAKQHYGYIFGEHVHISLGQDSDEDVNTKINNNIDSITMLEIHNTNQNETITVVETLWEKINSLSNLGSLKFFGVSMTGDQLRSLHNLKLLQEVSISNASRLDNLFKYFNNFPKLDSLSIDNSELVSPSWQNLQRNTKLRNISCDNCSLTDSDIVNFPSLQSLEYLSLRNNDLTCTNFGFMKNLSNLTRFHIWNNPRFGIDGLKIITTSSENILMDIDIQGCPLIDDSCMKYFLQMRKIQVICFYNTNITESGLKQLRTIKTLRQLFLPDQISIEFVKELQKEYMPKCHFNWRDSKKELYALELSEDYM
ncbi:MAG: hypothetical protein LBH59_00375 [Planctomycetaceae bacterium]|jgi:hypothetical protein|nr:hypothetical protein [Planctomycetaceae bacterium]